MRVPVSVSCSRCSKQRGDGGVVCGCFGGCSIAGCQYTRHAVARSPRWAGQDDDVTGAEQKRRDGGATVAASCGVLQEQHSGNTE